MRIRIETEALAGAFRAANAVAPKNHAKEVLNNILLTVADGEVVLEATDLEMGIRIEAEAVSVERDGRVLLPVTTVGRILGAITEDELTLDADDRALLITTAADKFRLPTMDPDEFPAIMPITSDREMTIGEEAFRRLVNFCAFCTDHESSRYALGGVLVEAEENACRMVGTDGRRLSTGTVAAELHGIDIEDVEHWKPSTCIVPDRAMKLMASVASGVVTIKRDLNRMEFDCVGVRIVSRLVEGRYPDWRQVIPPLADYHEVSVHAGLLAATVRKAAIACNRESRGILLELSDGMLHATGESETGEMRSEMVLAFDEDAIEVTVDYKFTLELCGQFEADDLLELNIKDESAPLLFNAPGIQHVIMPMARDRPRKEKEAEEPEEEPAEA